MLSEQPTELLDHISSCLDKPKDLLALALTAKLFCSIIIPNHLQFRELRCDIRRKSLWTALAKRPDLTSRFRSFEIISETEELGYPSASGIVIPRSVGEAGFTDNPSEWTDRSDPDRIYSSIPPEEDCSHAIASAVSCMGNLTRFCWESHGRQRTQHPELLFAALRDSCPNLNDLQIVTNEYPTSEFDTASFPLWELSNLSRVSVSVFHSVGIRFRDPLKYPPLMMNMLLDHCPFLRDLYIRYEGHKPLCISPLLKHGHWPQLVRFSTRGDTLVYHEHKGVDNFLLEKFLERHPAIECLQLAGSFKSKKISMKAIALPRLQSFSLFYVDLSKTIPVDTLQQLRFLASVHLDRGLADRKILGQMRALRFISVICDTVESLRGLAQAVPQLERLHLYTRPWKSYNYSLGPEFDDPMDVAPPSLECYEIFAGLNWLTHIGNFTSVSNFTALDDLIRPILERLTVSRNLRYIELFLDPFEPRGTRWITIERHKDGTFAGWHFTEDLRGVKFEDWGGIFTRIAEL